MIILTWNIRLCKERNENAWRFYFVPFSRIRVYAIPLTQNRTRAYLELDGAGSAPIDRMPPSAALQPHWPATTCSKKWRQENLVIDDFTDFVKYLQI